jgi:N-acetylglucosamine-6-phosphate deacetylase
VHVSPSAFRLLVRAKGAGRIALVTDSIRFGPWDARLRRGAYYTRTGVLAGSALTLASAVRNAVSFASLSVEQAVGMATQVPARLLGLGRTHGAIKTGARADLTLFDRDFCVLLTMVSGRVVFRRKGF